MMYRLLIAILSLSVACGFAEATPEDQRGDQPTLRDLEVVPTEAQPSSAQAGELLEARIPDTLPLRAEAIVVSVTDGDTLRVRVDGQTERLRMIGVDTPEVEGSPRGAMPFGAEASARTKEILPPGTRVTLAFDAERRDHYRRLLAHVYLEDATCVGDVLLAEGLARTITVPPNVTRSQEQRAIERNARRAHLGMWQ